MNKNWTNCPKLQRAWQLNRRSHLHTICLEAKRWGISHQLPCEDLVTRAEAPFRFLPKTAAGMHAKDNNRRRKRRRNSTQQWETNSLLTFPFAISSHKKWMIEYFNHDWNQRILTIINTEHRSHDSFRSELGMLRAYSPGNSSRI